jgi:UDP-N-acetylmuramoylalanine--D-glutamate ligase
MNAAKSDLKLNTQLCYGLLGLGKTGRSTIQWLVDHGAAHIVGYDSRENPPDFDVLKQDFPDVQLFSGANGAAFSSQPIDIYIASPGMNLLVEPQVSWVKNKPVWGDVELFARHIRSHNLDTTVIGITGSNGKSTVTEMTVHLLEKAGKSVVMAGNIGTPVLEIIAAGVKEPDYIVLELSSFQLDTTHELELGVATILNLSPDHLDRHQNYQQYGAAKQRIFANAEKAVVNRDDIESCLLTPGGLPVVDFSLSHSSATYFYDEDSGDLLRHDETLLSADSLVVQGKHNVANALAALALVEQVGVDPMSVADGLADYSGLEHRMTLAAECNGVKWINDSKATNVGATLAAVTGFDNGVHLILGGQSKGQDFSPLIEESVLQHCAAIYLFGESAKEIECLLRQQVLEVSVYVSDRLDDVVKEARRLVRRGEIVLFSPACSSFDQFANFEERGRVFTEMAKHSCLSDEGVK